MSIVDFTAEILKWLETTSLSVFILESEWAFPTIESVHVIAIALVVGTISVVDLRLLGLASTKRGFTELSGEVLPWTWLAFVVALLAGLLMFISHATEYFGNTAFQIKMLLMLLAGLNMIYFHAITCRNITEWDRSSAIPLGGRIAGGISLACWIAVVGFGRWIGFSMS
jgi:hypothetical protein